MAKAGIKAGTRTTGARTRAAIVQATIEALQEDGAGGASTRAIAKRAGVTQAAIFYHFDGLQALLLAALAETSARRLGDYREALGAVRSIDELVTVARRIFRDDLDQGHLTVLAELIAASSWVADLGPAITVHIADWTALTRETLARVLGDSALLSLVPLDDVAFGVVALYLGVELLTHLEGNRAPAEALFASAGRVGAVLTPLFGSTTEGSTP